MKRRSGIKIMGGLLRLLKPLIHVMVGCISLGTLGFFCAIFITVFAAHLILMVLEISPWNLDFKHTALFMMVIAVARAVLRYGEQTCGHYIAFKLLAVIRDKVFGTLRRLAPAKLEGRERGDLIAVITGDIELLEVFYAHTIAPVCIAFIVSAVMTILIGSFNLYLGIFAACSYAVVGVVIPLASSSMGRAQGLKARGELGGLNGVFLESLRGIREILQFGRSRHRADEIQEKTDKLNKIQGEIKAHEGAVSSWSAALVMLLPLCMLYIGIRLSVPFPSLVMTVVMLFSSFGPVLALANLSGAMDQTLAAGERVLSLLEEEPETPEIMKGESPDFTGAKVRNLDFSYDREKILRNLSIDIEKGEIVAVTGKSGSGKSTLLKLLMRFWQAPEGSIKISDIDIGRINTLHLRDLESFMAQDTDMFNLSVRENIRISRMDATDAEVEEAAKKAAIHDFIMTLPKGYATKTGELGELLSAGERQRIGLARAFLHNAPFMLFDEPTSNLDSLNEGAILKAIKEETEESNRTVVLVSHRKSTLSIADRNYTIDNGRLS
ncbi:MAG: ABC transporter ATP-binding protein [Anaerotignum sp.]|nr:ABC transporter ATP-binding protein [Anaerotignum sp.]